MKQENCNNCVGPDCEGCCKQNTQEQEKTREEIDSILLDIFVDIENELKRACKKANLNDYQSDIVKSQFDSLYELDKGKYSKRIVNAIQKFASLQSQIEELKKENELLRNQSTNITHDDVERMMKKMKEG